MIISHSKRFIFFACGKTGSTSIETVLGKYSNGEDFHERIDKELDRCRLLESKPFTLKHVRPAFVSRLMAREMWDSYYKFVFVRNPWNWVLSNYVYNFPYLSNTLFKFEKIHVEAVWYFLKLHNQIKNEDNGYYQHDFVMDQNGNTLVDFVGKFEDIQSDFEFVCNEIGIECEPLPNLNQSLHMNYRELYTREARELVSELYEKDIKLFNYKF